MNETLDAMIAAAEAAGEARARGESPGAACSCGTGSVEERWVVETIPYGDGEDTFEVEVPVIHCLGCDRGFTDQRAERLRHAAFCNALGLLAPDEVKEIRSSLGMSRREFDEAFGVPPASMERWENGRIMQNRSMDTLLRALRSPATAVRVDRRVERRAVMPAGGNVVWGDFERLSGRNESERIDLLRRRDAFRLRAFG
jgi:putative zinc finger/helix-turn-helix YgiT family protein